MKAKIFLNIKFLIYYFLTLPHVLTFIFSKQKYIIKVDIDRWRKIMKIKYRTYKALVYLLMEHKEYRNLFYYRIGGVLYFLLNIILPKMNSLFINTPAGKIGKGLFIHHGFATIIAAKEIGDNCWINQQVTIGYTNETDTPVLLNNVRVAAGAKLFGNIVCGNNCIVGANAVVTKNVPDDCTVVGVPAYVIKKDGVKVNHLPL